jgi:hypothetical protein
LAAKEGGTTATDFIPDFIPVRFKMAHKSTVSRERRAGAGEKTKASSAKQRKRIIEQPTNYWSKFDQNPNPEVFDLEDPEVYRQVAEAYCEEDGNYFWNDHDLPPLQMLKRAANIVIATNYQRSIENTVPFKNWYGTMVSGVPTTTRFEPSMDTLRAYDRHLHENKLPYRSIPPSFWLEPADYEPLFAIPGVSSIQLIFETSTDLLKHYHMDDEEMKLAHTQLDFEDGTDDEVLTEDEDVDQEDQDASDDEHVRGDEALNEHTGDTQEASDDKMLGSDYDDYAFRIMTEENYGFSDDEDDEEQEHESLTGEKKFDDDSDEETGDSDEDLTATGNGIVTEVITDYGFSDDEAGDDAVMQDVEAPEEAEEDREENGVQEESEEETEDVS